MPKINRKKNADSDADNTTETPATEQARELRFGDFVAPWDSIPVANQIRLAQRAFAHIMANETAATVTATRDKALADAAKAAKMEPVEYAAWLKDNGQDGPFGDVEKATLLHDLRTAKLALVLTGELGSRVGGPRLTPAERTLREAGEWFVTAKAREKGKTVPKGKDMTDMIAKAMNIPAMAAIIRAESDRRMANVPTATDGDEDLF